MIFPGNRENCYRNVSVELEIKPTNPIFRMAKIFLHANRLRPHSLCFSKIKAIESKSTFGNKSQKVRKRETQVASSAWDFWYSLSSCIKNENEISPISQLFVKEQFMNGCCMINPPDFNIIIFSCDYMIRRSLVPSDQNFWSFAEANLAYSLLLL